MMDIENQSIAMTSLTVAPKDPVLEELSVIALRHLEAAGPVMKMIQSVGRITEPAAGTLLGLSPTQFQSGLEAIFMNLYNAAEYVDSIALVREAPVVANKAGVVVSGMAGGFFGLAGLPAELPATTTIIFNAILKVARQHGFEPTEEQIRRECLNVFTMGGPDDHDDASGATFIANRLLLRGETVTALISRVSAEFMTRLTAKLGSQTVPVIGALSGGVINLAFINYYETVADIHFRLLKLAQDNPGLDVNEAYARALAEERAKKKAAPGLIESLTARFTG
jgi:hypothetical protein